MAAAESEKDHKLSTRTSRRDSDVCISATAHAGSAATPPADCLTMDAAASTPASPAIEGPPTPPNPHAKCNLNLLPALSVTRPPPVADLPPTPSSPSPAPATQTTTTTPARRDSKATRALLQLGAACRRISEVGLSAVTSAAVSWVLPGAAAKARRGGAAAATALGSGDSADPDPEAALSPRNSDLGSSFISRGGSSSAVTTPRKVSTPTPAAAKPSPPCARRFGSGSHHSAPQGPSAPSFTYGSSRVASSAWARHLDGSISGPCGTARPGSCSGPLTPPLVPMLPPSALALTLALPAAAVASAAPTSPTDGSAPPPPPPAAAAAQQSADAGSGAGFFRPRVTPADGLLYLAPCARASMWTPQRGTRWSLSQYGLHRRLYRGYASTVYKATCVTSSTEVVLKVYSLATLTDFLRHQVLRELDIHSRLMHPGIEADVLVMVLEYVRVGSLDQARKRLGGRLGEQWAVQLVVCPLLRVMSHLHRLGVVHRDIKPENILFTPDWRLKLCDFGVSIYLQEERAGTRAGSSDYMAPEVNACPLKRTPADNKVNDQLAYGASCDVWSLGAVVYELLVGFTPFPGGPPPGGATATATAAATAASRTRSSETRSAEPQVEGVRRSCGSMTAPAAAGDAAAAVGQATGGAAAAPGFGARDEEAAAALAAHDVVDGDAVAEAEAVTAAAGDATAAAEPPPRPAAAPPPPISSGSAATSTPSPTSSLAFPSRLSPAGRSFLLSCLEAHAGDRPTSEELMQHPWVLGAQQAPPPADGEGAAEEAPAGAPEH
ncbi:hypothetical protein PLESTM_001106700 [Pleodorina starrii]|nr:hypothetical protein PLESTM_001106700 [Pleodorina starrii]